MTTRDERAGILVSSYRAALQDYTTALSARDAEETLIEAEEPDDLESPEGKAYIARIAAITAKHAVRRLREELDAAEQELIGHFLWTHEEAVRQSVPLGGLTPRQLLNHPGLVLRRNLVAMALAHLE